MKAVIFDMDGVLFDTEAVCMQAWMEVAEKWGLPKMEEVFPLVIGLNANDSRQVVFDAYGEDFDYPLFREHTAAWFRDYVGKNGIPVKPGVREILEWLKSAGYAVGLASSTKRESVLSHLKHTGLDDYFSVVVGGDMVEHSKATAGHLSAGLREAGGGAGGDLCHRGLPQRHPLRPQGGDVPHHGAGHDCAGRGDAAVELRHFGGSDTGAGLPAGEDSSGIGRHPAGRGPADA